MSLYDDSSATYPELTAQDFYPRTGSIKLRNDGAGDYVEKWEYSKPLPEGLTLGKPVA